MDVGLVDNGKGINKSEVNLQKTSSFGKILPSTTELTDEQTKQLHKLREEAAKAGSK